MPTPTSAPLDTLSFEDAMAELEQIVRAMETGQTRLEDSIAAYERGMSLKRHAEACLKNAEMRIAQITQNADGTLGAAPFGDSEKTNHDAKAKSG